MAFVNVDGTRLYYREAGSGDPLLLIHGTGFNADVWDRVFERFARDYRTIAYDRRGYRRSQGSPPPAKCYARQQGEDIIALLEGLNAQPANLVGWSAGGIFALHAALLNPGRIKHLLLFEPPLFIIRYTDLFGFRKIMTVYVLKAMGRKQAAAETFLRMVLAYRDGRNSYEHLSPEFRAGLAEDTDRLLRELGAVMRDDLRPKALSAGIGSPTTLLLGEQSPKYLEKAARNLAAILRNAPILRLPDCNHLAHYEQPAAFVRAVSEALAAGKSSRPA